MTVDGVAVAVDVGGTGIKCALVESTGRVTHTERHPTGADRGPDAVVATIIEVAAGLAAKAHADGRTTVGVGVVIPGVVDESAGIAAWSANLGLRDVPLRDRVQTSLGLPTRLGHDVRAGALAEARLGAGHGRSRMLFVAIGTGIAGAFAVDGRVDPGAHGASGEIGHVVVRSGPEANPCGCGARGCLEAHASAAAIARAYALARTRPEGPPDHPLAPSPAGAREVAEAAAGGDTVAKAVWAAATDALADGLLTGIALYDPDVVVLGGGLAEAGAALLDPVEAGLEARRTFHRLPLLTRAALGDEAGCQGAALLMWEGAA